MRTKGTWPDFIDRPVRDKRIHEETWNVFSRSGFDRRLAKVRLKALLIFSVDTYTPDDDVIDTPWRPINMGEPWGYGGED